MGDAKIDWEKKRIVGDRLIDAEAWAIFDVLADPSRHPEIDGSGSVKATVGSAPQRLKLGSSFGMRMHLLAPYVIANKVVEFEEDRLLAWRHFGGHRWRYELEAVDGGTLVRETFDWSTSRSSWVLENIIKPFDRNREAIDATLERLEGVVAGG
ncbi:MAG TPA: dimethyladenosine transferase [Acidimicrobiales bacterium]|nr:dimethyladenosine transferase [Acidimicrobiales bacterium]